MPLYDKQCLNGHTTTIYAHTPIERYVRTVLCACGQTMSTMYSPGAPLTYLRESRPLVVTNMGASPLAFTSQKQHRDAMKRLGLAQPGVGRGMPGAWT